MGAVVVVFMLVIGVRQHKKIGPLKKIQKEAAAAAEKLKRKDLKADSI